MLKLHAGHIEPTYEKIALFLHAYGISDFTFLPINQGLENSSFKIETKGKSYVLRVYRQAKKPAEDITFELEFQRVLRSEGIPIPEVYPTIDGKEFAMIQIEGKPWESILMEYVEGNSKVEHYTPQLMRELAEYQAKMHITGLRLAETISDKSQEKWKDLHDTLGDKVKNLSVYDEETREFIKRLTKYRYSLSTDLPHGYNHLDLDLDGNIITKDDHIAGILDFDDLQYSPVVACLGFTCWEVLFSDGPQKMCEYLAEYKKFRALSDLECETLPHVIFFRNYVIGIIELHFLKNTPNFERILQLEKEIPKLVF